jgi:hypothetical protein
MDFVAERFCKSIGGIASRQAPMFVTSQDWIVSWQEAEVLTKLAFSFALLFLWICKVDLSGVILLICALWKAHQRICTSNSKHVHQLPSICNRKRICKNGRKYQSSKYSVHTGRGTSASMSTFVTAVTGVQSVVASYGCASFVQPTLQVSIASLQLYCDFFFFY